MIRNTYFRTLNFNDEKEIIQYMKNLNNGHNVQCNTCEMPFPDVHGCVAIRFGNIMDVTAVHGCVAIWFGNIMDVTVLS